MGGGNGTSTCDENLANVLPPACDGMTTCDGTSASGSIIASDGTAVNIMYGSLKACERASAIATDIAVL